MPKQSTFSFLQHKTPISFEIIFFWIQLLNEFLQLFLINFQIPLQEGCILIGEEVYQGVEPGDLIIDSYGEVTT